MTDPDAIIGRLRQIGWADAADAIESLVAERDQLRLIVARQELRIAELTREATNDVR